MARGKAASAEFSFENLAVMDAESLPKGTRDTAPNPLEQTVKDAADGPVKAIGPMPSDRAEEAARLIRRAVTVNDLSYRLRFTDEEDKPLTPKQIKDHSGGVWVYFQISSEKTPREYKPRAYTAADVRAWAVAEGLMSEEDKVTQETRNAYREAHGLAVRER